MKEKFKDLKPIQKILVIIILAVILIPAFSNFSKGVLEGFSDSSDNEVENVTQVENNQSDQNDPSKSQLEMIQATTQLALKKNGFKNDTSHSLENWEINSMKYDDTIRCTSVTQSSSNGRIKAIFDWSGEDKDDLILKYLLVNGNEVVNDLKKQ